MTQNLVSVIVPTYNRAYCLQRTLDSALAQTHRFLEVIVIDDGSTDGTEDLIRRAYAHERRVKYTYQKNRGVSAARNRGMRLAEGEYIAFLDSDDIWKPWKLELQVACLHYRPEVVMVWTDMEAIDPEGRVFNPKFLKTMYSAYEWFRDDELFSQTYPVAEIAPGIEGIPEGSTFSVGMIYSPMVMGNLVHTSTAVFRSRLLERVKGFNEEWRSGEDHDFHLRVCREGPVGFLNLSSIQYQKGMPDRLTRLSAMISENYLHTVRRATSEDRDRITLPAWMVNRALAEGHASAGEAYLWQEDIASARHHLARSLWHHPWQARTFGLLALSIVPRFARETLRRTYKRLKAGPA